MICKWERRRGLLSCSAFYFILLLSIVVIILGVNGCSVQVVAGS